MHKLIILIGLASFCGCFSAEPVRSTVLPDIAPVSAPVTPDPNAILPITYLDLDLPAMEADSVFHDYLLTQRVRDLDGQRVRIAGFMLSGSVYSSRKIKQFVMLRESEKDCPFGPGGQAHHAIAVTLRKPEADFTTQATTVEGLLHVQPFAAENGNALYVYVLDDAQLASP